MLQNKKGFTLIELIIVMAIIGILAVVAIVALSSKSGEARIARRKADVAAILTATALTCNDSIEKVNCTIIDGSGRGVFSECDEVLKPYLAMESVFDPQYKGVKCVVSETTGCDYTIANADAGTGNWDPCDVEIEFWLEDDNSGDQGTADKGNGGARNCATSAGIILNETGC